MDPGVDELSASAPVAESDTGDPGLVEGTNAAPAEVGGVEAAGAEGVDWNTAGSGVCGAGEDDEEEAAELKGTGFADNAGAVDSAVGTAGV